jgi:hypothetical protein
MTAPTPLTQLPAWPVQVLTAHLVCSDWLKKSQQCKIKTKASATTIKKENGMKTNTLNSVWRASRLCALALLWAGSCVVSFGAPNYGGDWYIGGYPVPPPDPLPCPPPYSCPTKDSGWFGASRGCDVNTYCREWVTYVGNQQERVDHYTAPNPNNSWPDSWTLDSSEYFPFSCGSCTGTGFIAGYNPTNWANFEIYVTNTLVVPNTSTNAFYITEIMTPVAINTLKVYDLGAQTVFGTYTNLSLPTNGTVTITNLLPTGTSAAFAAFVASGRLDAFFPFQTTSNGITPLMANRLFTMNAPLAPWLSMSTAFVGGQTTRSLIQLQDYSVVFSTGTVVSPPKIAAAVVGGGHTVEISWPAANIGWQLQVQTNSLAIGLNTNWFTVPGSNSTNQMVIPINHSGGAVFYRLRYP